MRTPDFVDQEIRRRIAEPCTEADLNDRQQPYIIDGRVIAIPARWLKEAEAKAEEESK